MNDRIRPVVQRALRLRVRDREDARLSMKRADSLLERLRDQGGCLYISAATAKTLHMTPTQLDYVAFWLECRGLVRLKSSTGGVYVSLIEPTDGE